MTLRLEAPASKSMTQRALVIAALADRATRIERALVCDDSRYLSELLEALGCRVTWKGATVEVTPAPLVARGAPVFCGNAGTAVRFGACLSLLCQGELILDGDEHMRSRPLGPLAESLARLGVAVRHLQRPGCPPIALVRRQAPAASVAVDSSLSSQYASGLLLVAPRLPEGLALELTGPLVSAPYLDMTVAMMERAGAAVARPSPRELRVAPGGYRVERGLAIEPDWSAAAFLLAAGRIAAIEVAVADLPHESLQGDAVFSAMLAALDEGATTFDLRDAPDLIAPLAAACLFAPQPTHIVGAAHARIKESDRVAVLARELGKLGARLSPRDDGLDIEPLADAPSGRYLLDPDGDHRMAMAFALLSLRVPGIEVIDPQCVSKSFPDFWKALDRIRSAARKL